LLGRVWLASPSPDMTKILSQKWKGRTNSRSMKPR
jgi:hypothetical protein